MADLPEEDVRPVVENPFFHRKPIKDRQYFFGRTEEIQRALRMLRNGECISIVGPRRIGKSSLLYHLCDPLVQQEHGLGEEYAFVYINCEGLGNIDEAQFYQLLWEEIKRALAGGRAEHWGEGISDFPGFCEALNTVQRRGHRLALFFDEFDTIATNPNFDRDHLFSDLRSLISTSTLVYATASQRDIYDLTNVDGSALSSPFFNVFTEIPLGFLKPVEAREMVTGLLGIAEQEDLFTEQDLDFVFDVGGYFPFFLQLACDRLFERKAKHEGLTASDYESVRKRYAEDAKPHFNFMWGNLDAGERKAVQLACEGKVDELTYELRQRLEKKCILFGDASFSSVFAEFVQRIEAKTNSYVKGGEPLQRRQVAAETTEQGKDFVALDILSMALFFGAAFSAALAAISSYTPLFWLAGFLALSVMILLLVRFLLKKR